MFSRLPDKATLHRCEVAWMGENKTPSIPQILQVKEAFGTGFVGDRFLILS
jgi:hypothetical protein